MQVGGRRVGAGHLVVERRTVVVDSAVAAPVEVAAADSAAVAAPRTVAVASVEAAVEVAPRTVAVVAVVVDLTTELYELNRNRNISGTAG